MNFDRFCSFANAFDVFKTNQVINLYSQEDLSLETIKTYWDEQKRTLATILDQTPHF